MMKSKLTILQSNTRLGQIKGSPANFNLPQGEFHCNIDELNERLPLHPSLHFDFHSIDMLPIPLTEIIVGLSQYDDS